MKDPTRIVDEATDYLQISWDRQSRRTTLLRAQQDVMSCEACNPEADIPFTWLNIKCFGEVTEKTLVEGSCGGTSMAADAQACTLIGQVASAAGKNERS